MGSGLRKLMKEIVQVMGPCMVFLTLYSTSVIIASIIYEPWAEIDLLQIFISLIVGAILFPAGLSFGYGEGTAFNVFLFGGWFIYLGLLITSFFVGTSVRFVRWLFVLVLILILNIAGCARGFECCP